MGIQRTFSKTKDKGQNRIQSFRFFSKAEVNQMFLLVQATIMWLQIFLILYYYKEVLEVGQN